MMQEFLNVCALSIQKAWKGHHYRSTYLPSIKSTRHAEEKIRSFIRGWKVRKVMQTREIFTMSQHIKDLAKVQEYFVYVEKVDNPSLFHQLVKDRHRAI